MSKILDCLHGIKEKSIKPDRPRSQSFKILEIDEEMQHVKIRFESGTPLYLHFKIFNAVIDYLVGNKKRFIRIGATNQVSEDRDTLE